MAVKTRAETPRGSKTLVVLLIILLADSAPLEAQEHVVVNIKYYNAYNNGPFNTPNGYMVSYDIADRYCTDIGGVLAAAQTPSAHERMHQSARKAMGGGAAFAYLGGDASHSASSALEPRTRCVAGSPASSLNCIYRWNKGLFATASSDGKGCAFWRGSYASARGARSMNGYPSYWNDDYPHRGELHVLSWYRSKDGTATWYDGKPVSAENRESSHNPGTQPQDYICMCEFQDSVATKTKTPQQPDGTEEQSNATDEEHNATDEEQNATDEEQNATDEEQNATDEEHNATDEEHNATDEEQNATDEEHNATDEEHNATDEEQNATDEEHNATDEEHNATDEEQNATDEEHNATDEEHNATDEEHNATDEEQNATDEEQNATDEEQNATDEEQNATDEEQNATDEEQNATDEEQNATDEEHNATDEEQNATDEEQNATDEEQNTTDEEQNATDEEHNATDEEHNATDEEHNATDEEHNATDEEQNTTDEEQNATDEEHNATDEEQNGSETRTPPQDVYQQGSSVNWCALLACIILIIVVAIGLTSQFCSNLDNREIVVMSLREFEYPPIRYTRSSHSVHVSDWDDDLCATRF
ncbi:unnamed protein product [Trypanosoma congolense IL3000]|uniref:WGS project CAEQ00000000 data, annotated contig 482 n=1 Tax=Trypanosoma congolense (strain IL3000) TaxID=1068625 RepID=F9WGA9_TRYCI|nr:unnamed protein product [Trypanosoma congolense IL3000]